MQRDQHELSSSVDSESKQQIQSQIASTNILSMYQQDIDLVQHLIPTVGIVGMGNIGSVLADVLTQKNVIVKCYDKNEDHDGIDSVKQCDIIWICVDTPTVQGEKDFDYTNLKQAYLLNLIYLVIGIVLFYLSFLRARIKGTLINMGE